MSRQYGLSFAAALVLGMVSATGALAASSTMENAEVQETLSTEAKQAWVRFQKTSQDDSSETAKAAEALLAALDKDLEALGDKIDSTSDSASAEAKEQWQEKRAALQEARDDLAESLDELSDSSKDRWDRAKETAGKAYDHLSEGLSKAWDEVTK